MIDLKKESELCYARQITHDMNYKKKLKKFMFTVTQEFRIQSSVNN